MGTINNRIHERFVFTPGMWVKVLKSRQKVEDFQMYQLLDVSQGGISFVSHKNREFKIGHELLILEVENLVLEDKIKAIVRYVMPMDEFGIDFKIGVEFLSRHTIKKAP